MLRRTGRFGKYLACSNYPECHNIISEGEVEVSAIRCPKCGENMVVKSGKFGKFLACPNYPSCKGTMPMDSNETPKLVGKCPDCGREMSARKTKKGKIYYSCTGYPECKFMSWDIPTGERCPTCGEAMITTPRGNVKCSNKECSYRVKTESKPSEKTEKTVKETTKKSATPVTDDGFNAPPPLMDEPKYFTPEEEWYGYFPPDFDKGSDKNNGKA